MSRMRNLNSPFYGPIAGIIVYSFLHASGIDSKICATVMITVWMAVWWITEAVDIGITSFLPFIFFPLTGVMDANEAAMQYMEQTIFLFIGGFLFAYALEKWNLHKRIAYHILLLTGTSPARVLAGTMIITALISMWISNTATVLMLLSAITAVIKLSPPSPSQNRFACALMLALAYAATIGGFSTLVGTPPNMVFAGFYEKSFPGQLPVSFSRWFFFTAPFSALFLILVYFILYRFYIFKSNMEPIKLGFIKNEIRQLGKISFEEKTVMLVFGVTVLLWFSRNGIHAGPLQLKGWSSWFSNGSFIRDSSVAMLMSLLLFLIPARKKTVGYILSWEDVKKLPLRIILLFGSGFALAKGFEVSGLSGFLASRLSVLKEMPLWLLLLILMLMVTLLSEFASNLASVQLVLPIIVPLALTLQVEPLYLMVPATISASFGYMMPVATAANTIVYGTGYVPVRQMMCTGFFLNLIGVSLLLIWMQYVKF